MEEKIKLYVEYQFRFDQREGVEDLKAEIIANLTDYYNEYIEEGKNPEEAYVSAIKRMGDFSENQLNEIPEEYSVKPSIPDILLMSGAILSIFGLLVTLLNSVVGSLVTALSILLFSGSAYYLYSYSQFVRKEHMDIEKHNMLLRKIFKYMKTSFVFWAISLSIILVSLIMNIITIWVITDVDSLSYNRVKDYYSLYVILFIVFLLIFLVIFKTIYDRLINHYYLLTGTSNLKGKIRESYEFLYGSTPRKSIILSHKFLPILGIIMILPQQFFWFSLSVWGDYVNHQLSREVVVSSFYFLSLIELLFTKYWTIAILPLYILIANALLIYAAFNNKIKRQWILIVSFYLWFLSTISISLFLDIFYQSSDYWITYDATVFNYAGVMLIILTVIVIIRAIIQSINKSNFKKDV